MIMKRVSWILAVVIPPSAFLLGVSLLERGTTICMVCASVREETLFMGIPVDIEPAVLA